VAGWGPGDGEGEGCEGGGEVSRETGSGRRHDRTRGCNEMKSYDMAHMNLTFRYLHTYLPPSLPPSLSSDAQAYLTSHSEIPI
jgi:hypothetical protein